MNESFGTVPPLRLAVAGTLVILSLYFPAQLAGLANPGFGLWFTEVFLFFGLAFVLVRMTGRDPVRYTGLRWSGVAPAAYGFALGVVNFFALAIPLQLLSVWLLPESWSQQFDSSRVLRDKAPIDLALIVAGVSVAAPVCEEFFFRGVLQRSLSEPEKPGPLRAMVIAAIVFSAFHLDPVGFGARVELGLVFGWLFWRTGSIWPGVMAHAANNLVSVVLFFSTTPSTEVTTAQLQQVGLLAIVGLTALGGLLLLASKVPAVLARRHPEELGALPPRTFYALAWPWALGAVLSIALLFAVDRRGVALSYFDATNPLPQQVTKDERERLLETRQRVRRGDAPREAYDAARKALIGKYAAADEGKEPVPVTPPPPVPTP